MFIELLCVLVNNLKVLSVWRTRKRLWAENPNPIGPTPFSGTICPKMFFWVTIVKLLGEFFESYISS